MNVRLVRDLSLIVMDRAVKFVSFPQVRTGSFANGSLLTNACEKLLTTFLGFIVTEMRLLIYFAKITAPLIDYAYTFIPDQFTLLFTLLWQNTYSGL